MYLQVVEGESKGRLREEGTYQANVAHTQRGFKVTGLELGLWVCRWTQISEQVGREVALPGKVFSAQKVFIYFLLIL